MIPASCRTTSFLQMFFLLLVGLSESYRKNDSGLQQQNVANIRKFDIFSKLLGFPNFTVKEEHLYAVQN